MLIKNAKRILSLKNIFPGFVRIASPMGCPFTAGGTENCYGNSAPTWYRYINFDYKRQLFAQ